MVEAERGMMGYDMTNIYSENRREGETMEEGRRKERKT